MAEAVDQNVVRVVDREDTPTLFVEGIRGMQVRDGVAILNLVEHIYSAAAVDDAGYDKTVVRLALSLPAFVRFADFFSSIKERLISEGAVTIEAPKPDGGELTGG